MKKGNAIGIVKNKEIFIHCFEDHPILEMLKKSSYNKYK